MNLVRSFVFTLFGIAAVGCMTGCSKGCGAPSSSRAPNSASLQFDYKTSTELLISKADPMSGDRWTARVVRDGAPSAVNENHWTIELGPDEMLAGDRKAHGFFILHLLDTIRTLQIKEAQISGTPESFGLTPPLFTLRWKAEGTPNEGLELRLGAPVKAADGSFDGLYASISTDPSRTYVAKGALLKMLERLSSFEALRLQTLATFTSDDIDEIELKRGGKLFYAQREGIEWKNAKGKTLPQEVGPFLDRLTHLRILRFIDDPTEQTRLEQALRTPKYRLTLKDRQGQPAEVKIHSLADGKAYASISTRLRRTDSGETPLVFEVYPEILKDLRQL